MVEKYEVNEEQESKYGIMDFGFTFYEMVNPKWAKLVFKLNNAGNLTIEASPSLTPGVKPEGMEYGKVPKGSKVFDYDKKIIISMLFSDCLKVIRFADNPDITTPAVKLYRNSVRFNKTVTLSYVADSNGVYANFNFESTDPNGIVTKFKLPMNLELLAEFAQINESYVNCFPMIKYYTQVETKKDEQNKNISHKNSTKEYKPSEASTKKNRYDVD